MEFWGAWKRGGIANSHDNRSLLAEVQSSHIVKHEDVINYRRLVTSIACEKSFKQLDFPAKWLLLFRFVSLITM
jgi:hypothetical protein